MADLDADGFTAEERAILQDQEVPEKPAPTDNADNAESAEAEAPVEPKAEEKPKTEDQPRTEDGKFAPKGASEAEAPKQPPQKAQRVPLSELLEERKSRQDAERATQAERERVARLEGALQTLSARFNQPQEQPKTPTAEEQPVEVLKQTQAEVNQLRQHFEARALEEQFEATVTNLVNQFRAQTPDYRDALDFVAGIRQKELEAFGLTPAEIALQLQKDQRDVSIMSLARNKNPGEVIYDLAKLRGYTGKVAGNGAQQRAAPDRLATIERGEKAARSLGNAGGVAPETLTGIDRIASMSESELSKLSLEEFRKIMEG